MCRWMQGIPVRNVPLPSLPTDLKSRFETVSENSISYWKNSQNTHGAAGDRGADLAERRPVADGELQIGPLSPGGTRL